MCAGDCNRTGPSMELPSPNIHDESARAYGTYDLADPPSHPGSGWTRFICISDTHSRTNYTLPSGDVLLHAGDLSSRGYPEQMRGTLNWLAGLKYPIKIIIAGNHDHCLDRNLPAKVAQKFAGEEGSLAAIKEFIKSREMIDANIYYLEHKSLVFESSTGRRWTVYGSPAAAEHKVKGAFQYRTSEHADALYDRIPDSTEILMTHTPPYGTLDRTVRVTAAGCQRLAHRLNSLPCLRLHVFGHIHESSGLLITPIVFVNAAIACPGVLPSIVDLKN